MPSVRVRVSAGVGAWIVGATTATGLSLFAVSYLGEDPQSPQGATLSQNQVNEALASASQTPGPSASSSAATPGATPSTPPSNPPPSTSATSAGAAPSHGAVAAQPVERRLSGDAGTVVAQCQNGLVYLEAWSPAQGYEGEVLQRGPARVGTVLFSGYGNHVAFHVSCSGGTPTLAADDDGGVEH